MGADLSGLGIRVPHPVLERSQGNSVRHPGAERVAQLVERDPPHLRSLKGVPEAPDELRSVERVSGLGVSAHEVSVRGVQGSLAQLRERVGDPVQKTALAAKRTVASRSVTFALACPASLWLETVSRNVSPNGQI